MFQTIKKFLKKDGLWKESFKDALKAILKDFTLIPKTTLDVQEQIFENLEFGFFNQALDEDEIALYMQIWKWGLADWKKRCDEDMGPFEFITLDIQIWQYLRILRMAKSEKGVEITPDTPGFMAEALYSKTGGLREKVWPRVSARHWNKKVVEVEEEKALEFDEIQMFRVGDQEMTEEEYATWSKELPPDKKVAMLGHVEPFIKKIPKDGGNDDE